MGHDPSDLAGVGAFAAAVLEDLYAAVFGERPVGVRAWCDGDALLMLLRLAGPAPFGRARSERGGARPYGVMPELVATAVRVQTGCELAVGSWSLEEDLGLVMFVFRLAGRTRGGALIDAPRAGAHGHAPGACPARVPSRRTWSPAPRATITSEGDASAESRLRLVEDARESGSVRS